MMITINFFNNKKNTAQNYFLFRRHTLIFFTLTFDRKGSSSDSTRFERPPRPLPRLAGAFRGGGLGFGLGGATGLALPFGALLLIDCFFLHQRNGKKHLKLRTRNEEKGQKQTK